MVEVGGKASQDQTGLGFLGWRQREGMLGSEDKSQPADEGQLPKGYVV